MVGYRSFRCVGRGVEEGGHADRRNKGGSIRGRLTCLSRVRGDEEVVQERCSSTKWVSVSCPKCKHPLSKQAEPSRPFCECTTAVVC